MTNIFDQPQRCFLVRGVPGGGKSQYLIDIVDTAISQGYNPGDIFVGSFSRNDSEKFASRLEHRLTHTLVPVHTIHSLCYRIVWADVLKRKLRKFLSSAGTLNIADDKGRADAILLAKTRHIRDMKNDPPLNDKADYLGAIGLAKSKGIRPSEQLAKSNDYHAMYYHYQHAMNSLGLMDFGDLLLRAESVLKTDEDIREAYCYKLMLLDECQDLSEQQMKVLELLVTRAEKVVWAYDVNQSIYAFRGAVGADIEKRIRKIFSADDIASIDLLENHRSLPKIVEHAEKIFHRGMVSVREIVEGDEGVVTIYPELITSEKLYAKQILEYVKGYADEGFNYGDIHILCRTRAVMAPVNEILVSEGIPTITGGMPFTQRSEVKDLIAWLRLSDPRSLLETPKKSHPFIRVYNRPLIPLRDADKFGITNKNGDQMHLDGNWLKQFRKQAGTIEQRLRPSLYNDKYARAVNDLSRRITHIQSLSSPTDVLTFVINMMGDEAYGVTTMNYRQFYASQGFSSKLDYLQMLIDLSEKKNEEGEKIFKTVPDFLDMLETIDKLMSTNAVEINTIHSSKGIDGMKVVIMVNNPFVDRDEDEARRIRYVAATRAGERLNIVNFAQPIAV